MTVNAIVITLPGHLDSISATRKILQSKLNSKISSIVLDAHQSYFISSQSAKELMRGLQKTNAERVVVLNASEAVEKIILRERDRNIKPGEGFLMLFQERDEEVFLRPL